jgi:hypothetical protein
LGDGAAHLHMWFLARPHGRLQLRGTFLSLWDDILPVIPEYQWRENLALVAAWLAEFGGTAIAEPPHIQWESPSTIAYASSEGDGESGKANDQVDQGRPADSGRPATLGDIEHIQSAHTIAAESGAQGPESSNGTKPTPAGSTN